MRLTSLSLFISSPSFSLWLQDTCHLMPFTKYSLLDQSYFFTSCLSIAHIKFTNKIHQLFTDYLLRLPYSELLETHLFRSRANRRLVCQHFWLRTLRHGNKPLQPQHFRTSQASWICLCRHCRVAKNYQNSDYCRCPLGPLGGFTLEPTASHVGFALISKRRAFAQGRLT